MVNESSSILRPWLGEVCLSSLGYVFIRREAPFPSKVFSFTKVYVVLYSPILTAPAITWLYPRSKNNYLLWPIELFHLFVPRVWTLAYWYDHIDWTLLFVEILHSVIGQLELLCSSFSGTEIYLTRSELRYIEFLCTPSFATLKYHVDHILTMKCGQTFPY